MFGESVDTVESLVSVTHTLLQSSVWGIEPQKRETTMNNEVNESVNDGLLDEKAVNANLDALLADDDGQKLNSLAAVQDFDGKRQHLLLGIDLDALVASAVRKTVTQDGKTRKMSPAVMFCADADKIPYERNGVMYEISLSLGRKGVGAYLPFKIRKVGEVKA